MKIDQLSQNSWLKSLNWLLKHKNFADLNASDLINDAQNVTKLESFGPFFNHNAFNTYINDINESQTIHQFGRFALEKKIRHHLIDSLNLQLLINQSNLPNTLNRVVLITGLWRTGTTFLQRELSKLPAFQSSLGWEVLYPLYPTTNKVKSRIKASATIKLFNSINPLFNLAHPVSFHQEEEDMPLFDLGFTSTINDVVSDLKNYSNCIEQQDLTEMYKAANFVHQLHLKEKPKSDWFIIKSPHHMDQILTMHKLYPDLHIIRIIRDEEESIKSLFNLVYHGWRTFHHSVNKEMLKKRWLQKVVHLSKKYKEAKKDIDQDRFIEIRYKDLINDFGKSMHYIGRRLNVDIDPLKIYPRQKRKTLNAKHTLNLNDFGTSALEIKSLFEPYAVQTNPINELLANA
jgi:hypothetical protein